MAQDNKNCTVEIPATTLPVVEQADVVVAGGGTAGFVAAVAAARTGARTLLVERWGYLAGCLTGTYNTSVSTFGDSEGVQVIRTLLDDGAIIPFATDYDDDYPPPLHMLFLNRHSPEATPRNDGGWATDRDPLVSVMNGFRLNAYMRANPSLSVTQTVEPDYNCQRNAFSFQGQRGSRGQIGGEPQPSGRTVSSDQLRQPRFVDRDRSLAKQIDLLPVAVDTGDVVTRFGQAGSRHQPHVAGSDYNDFHDSHPCCSSIRRAEGGRRIFSSCLVPLLRPSASFRFRRAASRLLPSVLTKPPPPG